VGTGQSTKVCSEVVKNKRKMPLRQKRHLKRYFKKLYFHYTRKQSTWKEGNPMIPKISSSNEVFKKPFSVDKVFGKVVLICFGIFTVTLIWELIKW
jgi:hypothetical protein